MRYPFIHQQSRHYRVTLLCRVMQVDRRGYYRWLGLQAQPAVSTHQAHRHRLKALVIQLFRQYKGKVGSRFIVHQLRRQGHPIGRYRVRKMMHEAGLVCRIRKAYQGRRSGTNPHLVFELNAEAPQSINQRWVTDITYLRTRQGWRYLSVVLDAYSRRMIGYALEDHLRVSLIRTSLDHALKQRTIANHAVVIHSDRGSQYTSHEWHQALQKATLIGSMSAQGYCYDNAIMERFFGTLKDALVVDEPLTDASLLQASLKQWMVQYNHQRTHSALAGLTPAEFERTERQKLAHKAA